MEHFHRYTIGCLPTIRLHLRQHAKDRDLQKVAAIRTLEEAADLHDELVDRFGDLPQAVFNLLSVARLKAYGAEYRIETISQKGMIT